MTQQVVRLILLFAVSFGGLSAHAQQQPSSMVSMMQQCREHQQTASASMEEMLRSLEQAEQSGDPAKLRQVVQDAQRRMRDMRQNMAACTNMMNQMQGTSGMMGGGMMSGGMMSGCPGCGAMEGMMGGGGMVVAWIGGVLLVLIGLALTATLVALAAYLWNRSRALRQTPV